MTGKPQSGCRHCLPACPHALLRCVRGVCARARPWEGDTHAQSTHKVPLVIDVWEWERLRITKRDKIPEIRQNTWSSRGRLEEQDPRVALAFGPVHEILRVMVRLTSVHQGGVTTTDTVTIGNLQSDLLTSYE